jgi:hypothetical protein
MKKINNFIQEKLKVNSKTNVQSTVFEEILEYWGLKYEKKEINDAIKKWIKDNNVNDVEFIADKVTLKNASEFLSDEVLELYKLDKKSVNNAYDELECGEFIYHHSGIDDNIDIMANNNVIAIIGWYGILYCVKK